MPNPLSTVFLSRRNLLALLSKLDRQAAGDTTACTIIKHQQDGSQYRQTMKQIQVTAVEDEVYYGAQSRPAGIMVEEDEKNLPSPSTGTALDFTTITN